MKRLIIFILLLVNSFFTKSFACYFYPYGEDIRFSVFNPYNLDYSRFAKYNYTYSKYYYENYIYDPETITENDLLWFNHCRKKIDIKEIKKAVFENDVTDIHTKSKNKFIQYLYKTRDFETINYLIFAKEIEKLQPTGNDLWETNSDAIEKKRNQKIQDAIEKISKTSNVILQKRYYYQAFKLLSYNGDSKKIIELYNEYEKRFKSQDFLDNWAMHYRMTVEPSNEKMNYFAAQVFCNGTDNRFDVSWYFNRNIPIKNVLIYAKNDTEKANILVLYSFKKLDQNLENLKNIYNLDAKNEGLGFLLLREINKLEDWILTPSYTMYLPVLREDYWENSNEKRILNRVEIDRLYAKKVLDFVAQVDFDKVDNKAFWILSKAYLEFLTKDFINANKTIKSLEKMILGAKMKKQLNIIKALVKTANQDTGSAIILHEIKPILLAEQHNYSFLFAIAKELEILENKVDAAFLISKISPDNQENEQLFWKSRKGKQTLYDDFYSDWYGYIDAELSTVDMQNLLFEIKNKATSTFDLWKTKTLRAEKNKTNDLMGIKYMRDNNLKMAYQYFLQVSPNHYTNAPLFNENPFYKIKGYMNFDPSKKTTNLTKDEVVKTLINLINKTNKANYTTKHQDYFKIANCYYNMSYYGNSWMLKRISRTENRDINYEDEADYYACRTAKSYYEKALKSSKSKTFQALCSYMIGKCDARKNEHELLKTFNEFNTNYFYIDYKKMEEVNEQAFKKFISKYPNEYLEMVSNCEIFSVYYNSNI